MACVGVRGAVGTRCVALRSGLPGGYITHGCVKTSVFKSMAMQGLVCSVFCKESIAFIDVCMRYVCGANVQSRRRQTEWY